MKKKIIRITTVPLSLDVFCRGLLRELSEEYEVVAVSSPGPLLDEVARREGVRTAAVPMERRIAPLKDIASLWRLVRLFRKERPDMVHSMTPKAGLLSMMAARLTGVPVRLHTFTGLVFPSMTGMRRRLLELTDRLTAACATHIVPEGEGVRDDLLRFGITRKPLRVLGYGNVRGIDLDWYDRTPEVLGEAESLRRRFGIGPDAFTFVFVGRLVADKGIRELTDAFFRLWEEGRKVHLLLCGETEAEDPLPDSTRHRMETCPCIHFSAGWLSDVRPWYAAADALVHSSYREGFPNTVIEAGAMRLPCIVTDINGSREIIRDGENGRIVPPRDEEALYGAMKAFLEDPDALRVMSMRARKMVATRFEQGYVRSCLKDFYHEILV
ncbi:MAG: glycosyltransferase family 4 protein [Bacteroidales bacterium]|nr:glycosyltransferase family 4 protein [Bacteroidales bacterium]